MRKTTHVICLLAASLLGSTEALGQTTREIKKTLPVGPNDTVSIETFKGNVVITTWDAPQVEILARIEPDGASPNDQEKIQNTDVKIEESGGVVRIKSDYDKLNINSFGWDDSQGNLPFVNYTIKMPSTARLQISDHKSITKVDGLRSEVRINTHRGSVSITGFQGSINLQTHRGDAKVEFASLGRENFFESHRGNIEVVIPRGGGFNLESSVGKGGSLDSDLDLKGLVQSRDRRSIRYGGAVNGGGPSLRMFGDKAHFRLEQR